MGQVQVFRYPLERSVHTVFHYSAELMNKRITTGLSYRLVDSQNSKNAKAHIPALAEILRNSRWFLYKVAFLHLKQVLYH
jgi:hypothetical protein